MKNRETGPAVAVEAHPPAGVHFTAEESREMSERIQLRERVDLLNVGVFVA